MDDQDAESKSNEELLVHTREFRDELRPRAAELRELGLEVDSFLEECDRLIAFLEGRSDEWVEVAGFLEKLSAFNSEVIEFAEINRQAERIKAVSRSRACWMPRRISPGA